MVIGLEDAAIHLVGGFGENAPVVVDSPRLKLDVRSLLVEWVGKDHVSSPQDTRTSTNPASNIPRTRNWEISGSSREGTPANAAHDSHGWPAQWPLACRTRDRVEMELIVLELGAASCARFLTDQAV